ncbi:MAG: hypothetical protein ACI4IG_04590 [Eubacterium sp.]
MKKALILFAIVFAVTALIPLISIVKSNQQSSQDELVTIFSSSVSFEQNYHLL